MATGAHSRCRSASNALLIGSLCMIVLGVLLLPILEGFWLLGVGLAATGLLTRILGVLQMSLAAWTAMILSLSVAVLLSMAAMESETRELRYLGAVAILPSLIVWILGTFACWLFIDRALGPREFGVKCAHFVICFLAPPGIAGAIITTVGFAICLICIPLSWSHAGDVLGWTVLWGLGAVPCWLIVHSFQHLIRSARTAHRAQLDAATGERMPG